MQLIAWLIKIIIFIALLGFALGNTETVRLGVFGNQDIGMDGPLVVFLLMFFFFGLLIGLLTLVPRLVRLRRQVSRQTRELEKLRKQVGVPAQDDIGLVAPAPARLPSA